MFKTATFLSGLVLGVAIALGINSWSGDLSLLASGGQCQYGHSAENMWHQQGNGQETHRDYKPRCGQVGFAYKFDKSRWGLNAGYMNGGTARLSATAINYPDDDASKHNPLLDPMRQECRNGIVADCGHRIRGEGGIEGFFLVATFDLLKVGKVIVEGGGGALVYRAHWNARILPLDPDCFDNDNKCKWQAQVNQQTGWLLSPNLHLKLKYDWLFFQVQEQFRTVQHAPISAGYANSHRS